MDDPSTTDKPVESYKEDMLAEIKAKFLHETISVPLPPWLITILVVIVGLLSFLCCLCIFRKCCYKKDKRDKEEEENAVDVKDMDAQEPCGKTLKMVISKFNCFFKRGNTDKVNLPKNTMDLQQPIEEEREKQSTKEEEVAEDLLLQSSVIIEQT